MVTGIFSLPFFYFVLAKVRLRLSQRPKDLAPRPKVGPGKRSCVVTNLNDSGPGSFRDAVSQGKSNGCLLT